MIRWLNDPTKYPVKPLQIAALVAAILAVFGATAAFFQGEPFNGVLLVIVGLLNARIWVKG